MGNSVLLPMTNTLLHVCHACRGRVACHVVLNVSACYQPGTRSYRALSLQTFFQVLSGRFGQWILQGFSAAFYSGSPHDLPGPIHRTRNNGASIPAANWLYQGWTIEAEATHMS